MRSWKRSWGSVLLTGVMLVAAFGLGAAVRRESAATAGVRKPAPQEAFLAGSERSLPILQEIAVTLKRIDTRLANLEKVALQPPRP